ncbi:MAG TPA: hypothetical protein VHE99_09595 [Gammaproteobacteria bacterium]|nr:hypothetical protein [Gammaproteobacteria bacterium]
MQEPSSNSNSTSQYASSSYASTTTQSMDSKTSTPSAAPVTSLEQQLYHAIQSNDEKAITTHLASGASFSTVFVLDDSPMDALNAISINTSPEVLDLVLTKLYEQNINSYRTVVSQMALDIRDLDENFMQQAQKEVLARHFSIIESLSISASKNLASALNNQDIDGITQAFQAGASVRQPFDNTSVWQTLRLNFNGMQPATLNHFLNGLKTTDPESHRILSLELQVTACYYLGKLTNQDLRNSVLAKIAILASDAHGATLHMAREQANQIFTDPTALEDFNRGIESARAFLIKNLQSEIGDVKRLHMPQFLKNIKTTSSFNPDFQIYEHLVSRNNPKLSKAQAQDTLEAAITQNEGFQIKTALTQGASIKLAESSIDVRKILPSNLHLILRNTKKDPHFPTLVTQLHMRALIALGREQQGSAGKQLLAVIHILQEHGALIANTRRSIMSPESKASPDSVNAFNKGVSKLNMQPSNPAAFHSGSASQASSTSSSSSHISTTTYSSPSFNSSSSSGS